MMTRSFSPSVSLVASARFALPAVLCAFVANCSTTTPSLSQGDDSLAVEEEEMDAVLVETAAVDSDDDSYASMDDLYADLGFDDEYADEPDGGSVGSGAVFDPLRPINSKIFWFNDKLTTKVLKPVSRGYDAITPDFLSTAISNVFGNARYPSRLVNNVLQGKWAGARKETASFLVDTTAGIGGITRPSKDVPSLQVDSEDFGQTLGSWGLGSGPYLVLPVLGPSNLRDGIGLIADGYLDPTLYSADDFASRVVIRGAEVVNSSPDLVARYEGLVGGALDPYVGLRDAYGAFRAEQISK